MTQSRLKSVIEKKQRLTLGLMSGTSADGVDISLCEVNIAARHFTNIAAQTIPYPDALRDRVLSIAASGIVQLPELIALSMALGTFYVDAITGFTTEHSINLDNIDLVGSHGQTVAHLGTAMELAGGRFTGTLQIGEAEVIAKTLGIVTVSDFRSGDTAVGGSGAPLAPIYHQFRFSNANESRAVINIGGVSNITLLSPNHEIAASDTGPGNCLIDTYVKRMTGQPHDMGGQIASKGSIDRELLDIMISADVMKRALPTSFDRGELVRLLDEPHIAAKLNSLAMESVVATLTELTAHSIQAGIQSLSRGGLPRLAVVCGGGAHNDFLINRLRHHLPDCKVASTSEYGVDADFVEAEMFAYLANLTLDSQFGNLTQVTGASRGTVLGKISQP